MRQRLGTKKHRKCEAITGRKYTACLVRGGGEHFSALCLFGEPGKPQQADRVNYVTGEWWPDTRDGLPVDWFPYAPPPCAHRYVTVRTDGVEGWAECEDCHSRVPELKVRMVVDGHTYAPRTLQ